MGWKDMQVLYHIHNIGRNVDEHKSEHSFGVSGVYIRIIEVYVNFYNIR